MTTAGEPLPEQATVELLTVEERGVVHLLAQAMNLYANGVVGDGWTRQQDLREFGSKVHDLQNAVLAQAAARTYPHLYRLAGHQVADRTAPR